MSRTTALVLGTPDYESAVFTQSANAAARIHPPPRSANVESGEPSVICKVFPIRVSRRARAFRLQVS